ncbi:MAG TPA: hypothetical protein VHN39_03705, partial [Phenylobacterium sp.]|nr:hypothetical protein [Phenylobacterium sp.]
MNRNLRAVAALASLAFVALAAAPALASGFCDPEEGPCGPPPPPPPPTLPGTVGTFGNYAVSLGTIQNSVFRQGVYQNGLTTFNGGGPLVPVGNNGVLTVGQPNNTVTLAPTLSPLGSVMVAAVATTPQDPVFPGFDLVARGSLELSYLVDLHANNQAAADALTNLLSVNGGIARINGDYSLTATGPSWGSVIASTGTSELANGL